MKTSRWFLNRLKMELPYNLAIYFRVEERIEGRNPKDLKAGIWVGIYIPIFIAALFKRSKGRSNPTDPWWMDKQNVVDAHNGVSFSRNKEGACDICYMMNPEDIIAK